MNAGFKLGNSDIAMYVRLAACSRHKTKKEYNSNVESSVLTFDQYALPIGSDDMDPASDPIRVSVRCPSLRAGWDQCNTPIGSASSMDAGCVGIAEVFTPLPSHLN